VVLAGGPYLDATGSYSPLAGRGPADKKKEKQPPRTVYILTLSVPSGSLGV